MGDSAYEKRHKASGLCIKCPKSSLPHVRYCAKHYYNKLMSDRRYYYRHREMILERTNGRKRCLKAENKCTNCGKPLIEGEGYKCLTCRSGLTTIGRRKDYEVNYKAIRRLT